MGLDMYLSKVTKDGKIEDAAYWRKANQIHAWLVKNVQDGDDDCSSYEVSKVQLRSLLKDVNAVLRSKKKAPQILPTTEGFFFGTTEYDGYYFDDLNYTKAKLTDELRRGDAVSYHYQSSW